MPAKFIPEPQDQWYYDIPSPHLKDSPFYTTFIEPFNPSTDRSHGRYLLPFSPRENEIRNDTKYTVWDKRVFLNGEKTDWIFYQVWEDKAAAKRKNRRADIIYCHGINDYGGKFADHAPYFLEAGYRTVCPDLPSHGRSTGLHAYVTSMESLAEAVDAVICDVALCDRKNGATDEELDTRKRFIAGSSMGGFTALFYTVQYPPEPISEAAESAGIRSSKEGRYRPRVDGALILCPMLEISPESRPSLLVEYVARALSKIAGRWPLAEANKGKNSEDPTAEQESDNITMTMPVESDPQGYSGKLRISTGLSILQGILNMNSRIAEVNLPFKVFHGTGDRVTNPKGSQRLFDGCSSRDKDIQLYEGYEHVLLRKGKDKQDDERRQRVLKDMLDWLEKRS